MRIEVRLFALQRQQLGVRRLTLEVGEGATIEDAWAVLCVAHPVLSPARGSMRFARNGTYADPGDPLTEGDELALIPPVAGGAASAEGGGASGDGPAAAPDDGGTAADPDVEVGADRPVRWIALSDEPIRDADLAELRAAVATDADGAV
jgi:molybdopterin converting factor small subunit